MSNAEKAAMEGASRAADGGETPLQPRHAAADACPQSRSAACEPALTLDPLAIDEAPVTNAGCHLETCLPFRAKNQTYLPLRSVELG
jgi:hypothetical protein